MEDVDADSFGQLVHWLYTAQIEHTQIAELVILGKLWLIADRVLTPKLQNCAMDVIYTFLANMVTESRSNKGLIKTFIELVFETEQEEDSRLRKLLVDHFAFDHSHRIDI